MNKGFSALIPLIGGMEHAVWGIFEGVLGSDSRREWKGFIDDDMVYISGRQKITRKMLILIPTLDLSGGFFLSKSDSYPWAAPTSECAFETGGEATGLEEKGRNDQKYNYIELIVYFAKSVGCGSPNFTAVSYIGVSARKAIDTGEHACSCIL